MLRISVAAGGILRVEGKNAAQLLEGPESTLLGIVLGYRGDGANALVASPETSTPDKLVELVRFLRESDLEFQLSPEALELLKARRAYLKQFQDSMEAGLKIAKAKSHNPSIPKEFRRKLKSYQKRGVQHLLNVPYAANFSVPGSGKTTMVLGAYSALRKAGEVDKIVVIGPRSAFAPWEDEYKGCFKKPAASARIVGLPVDRRHFLRHSDDYEMFLATYQMLANEQNEMQRLFQKHKVLFVVDESHHIKKGQPGVWFQAARDIAPLAARRVILSGTPAPNTLDDLKPQMDILWPGIREVEGLFGNGADAAALARLREGLKPLYVRVRKTDLKLPPRSIRPVPVNPGAVQGRIYDALSRKVLEDITPDWDVQEYLRELRRALVVRLLQASTNPTLLREYSQEFKIPPLEHLNVEVDELIKDYTRYEVPPKLGKAVELATTLADRDEKSIVWTSFVHNVKTLKRAFRDADVPAVAVAGSPLDLEDPNEKESASREELLHQFRTDEDTKILVATIPSIGESVSLHQSCHNAIYLDRTFNCGLYMQSMDRIHRVGLAAGTKTTFHVLETRRTIDEVIGARLEEKMRRMHRLLNDDIGVLDLESTDDFDTDFNEADSLAIWKQLVNSQ